MLHRNTSSEPSDEISKEKGIDGKKKGTDGKKKHERTVPFNAPGKPAGLDQQHKNQGKLFRTMLGFRIQDVASWDCFVKLLCRPCDPAALGTARVFFGVLMVLDVIQERGLATADSWWGSHEECRFPLFDFLRPLPLQWMYIVYVVMLTGAVGIMLGFKMRLSSLLYLAPYWYVFFLDKTAWNNHSYLFGVLAFLFAISDANRYWSLDALLNPRMNNKHIPLWNYTLLRTQIFIVYFIAGLKKLDMDWVLGYSMQSLSHHWIFDPIKMLLTESQIDLYIVHMGGLVIDLSVGFLLFFDKTRVFGFIISTTFHLMNSQLFSIGMFPYAMMAMQTLFCSMSWPRKYFRLIPPSLRVFTPEDVEFQMNSSCIYDKDCVKPENQDTGIQVAFSRKPPPISSQQRHKLASLFTVAFIAWQFFLPYSHGITKGYNNWTNGLYGYSWDMMVHSWSVQHIRIKYYNTDTGQSGYLDPMVWTGGNRRWSSHGDMIKQYAHCIANNLRSYNITNVEIYFDIWRSLNYRFQQRMIDPRVDVITAEWSPFRQPSWMMPLLTDLSNWRDRLDQIQASLGSQDHADVVFVADFPGMHLENYVQPDFQNTSIRVLAGEVLVELLDENRNITLRPNQSLQIKANTFHNVHTVSATPSCYMYAFINTTEAAFVKRYTQFEEDYNQSATADGRQNKYQQDPSLPLFRHILAQRQAPENTVLQTLLGKLKSFIRLKYNLFRRSIRMSTGAIYCLATGSSFSEFLNATYQWETGSATNQASG